MQATIKYRLSEAAQRACMVATGAPVARVQALTFDLQPEDLELFTIDPVGNVTLDLTSMCAYNTPAEALIAAGVLDAHCCATAFEPNFVDGLRRGQEILARAGEAQEAVTLLNGQHNRAITSLAYERFLADPCARYAGLDKIDGIARPADWFPWDHTEFRAEVERRNIADIQAKEAARAEKERAKEEYIARWFDDSEPTNADEATREQFREGLLSRADALVMIAAAAFEPYAIAEWEPRICADRDCGCGSRSVTSLPPREAYAKYHELKAKCPTAAFEVAEVRECLRDENGEIDEGEDAALAVLAVTIKLPVGPFVFERLTRL